MSGRLRGELAGIVSAIESDIIFGRLPPGARLVEDVLMARFSATRHTIRQALGELERNRIAIRERHVGATVRSYRSEEVLEIYQVRELLQRQAALMISLPAPLALIERLEGLNQRFADAAQQGDLRRVHELNDAFHLTLFGACGNHHLVGSIAEYMALSLPIRATSLADAASVQISCRQHATMIALLRDTDNWALAQLCVEHVWPSKLGYLRRVAAGSAAILPLAARQTGRRRPDRAARPRHAGPG